MNPPKSVTSLDPESHPPHLHEAYRSTVLRAPKHVLTPIPQTLSELTGPVYGHDDVDPLDSDLTKNAARNGEPLGERITVVGRVLDENNRPVPHALVEVWEMDTRR